MGELLVKEDLLKVAIWVPVKVKVLTTTKLRFAQKSGVQIPAPVKNFFVLFIFI